MSVETAVQQLTEQVTGTPQQTQSATSVPVASQEAPQGTDFENWYDGLDETARTHADAYSKSSAEKLQRALESERQQRKELQKQLKELANRPVDDSAWKSKIEEINGQLSEASLKAAFYEAAVDVANLPAKRYAAAYKIAKLDGLISEEGEVDWKALQEQHDYLFSAQQVVENSRKPGSAGAGLGSRPQSAKNMNDLIRGGR